MRLKLFADGGSRGNPGPAACGAVLYDSAGKVVAEVAEFLGENFTNNQAEYAGVLLGIRKALSLKATEIAIYLDSKLVVEQVSGRWKIKDLKIRKVVEKIHAELARLDKWEISHIPREKNSAADALVNQALDFRGYRKTIYQQPFSRF
ncbi:MAG: ribonuclease HI family protein [Candidatus Gracilibacteria bacterium]|jgi:ribonuclease HI|nr:ribonuclease HI family protein [Candidatus Gracilibacteria bacterium]MDD5179175.1 ribonuclease HI family protein [Candidatus Gracilibacteria bacterium]